MAFQKTTALVFVMMYWATSLGFIYLEPAQAASFSLEKDYTKVVDSVPVEVQSREKDTLVKQKYQRVRYRTNKLADSDTVVARTANTVTEKLGEKLYRLRLYSAPQWSAEADGWWETEYAVVPTDVWLDRPLSWTDWLIPTVWADTTTTAFLADTWASSPYPTDNLDSVEFYIGCEGACSDRAFFSFTTPAVDGTITSSSVWLYKIGKRTNAGSNTAELHTLTRTDWVETQLTWNIYKTGSNWTSAGGDYTATVIDSYAIDTGVNEWRHWCLDSACATNPIEVDWSTTYHFLARGSDESTINNADWYNSSEAASNVPYVEIIYTSEEPPEPPVTTTPAVIYTAGGLSGFIDRYHNMLVFLGAFTLLTGVVLVLYNFGRECLNWLKTL